MEERYLDIEDNPHYLIKAPKLSDIRRQKRKLLTKTLSIINKGLPNHYKKKRKARKEKLKNLIKNGDHFELLGFAEEERDVHFGRKVKYEPEPTEKAENKLKFFDPKNLIYDNFEERCYTYPTYREDLEDVKLQEESKHSRLRSFEDFLAQEKIVLDLDLEAKLDLNEIDVGKLKELLMTTPLAKFMKKDLIKISPSDFGSGYATPISKMSRLHTPRNAEDKNSDFGDRKMVVPNLPDYGLETKEDYDEGGGDGEGLIESERIGLRKESD